MKFRGKEGHGAKRLESFQGSKNMSWLLRDVLYAGEEELNAQEGVYFR